MMFYGVAANVKINYSQTIIPEMRHKDLKQLKFGQFGCAVGGRFFFIHLLK
jgi:hypothetical protein